MPDRHSIYPVDHFSHDIPEAALRGLVERHDVSFELGPNQVVGAGGEIVRRGWVVDLYARESEADAALPAGELTHHVFDVLHALARTLVPEERRGVVNAQLERFTGAVRIDPRHDYDEEVRLRIQLEPNTTARMTLVDDADTTWRDELVEKLEGLGAKQRGG